jgi:hypothetical protein
MVLVAQGQVPALWRAADRESRAWRREARHLLRSNKYQRLACAGAIAGPPEGAPLRQPPISSRPEGAYRYDSPARIGPAGLAGGPGL